MSIFEHELKTSDIRVVLNSTREHIFKSGYKEEYGLKEIRNAIEGFTSTPDKKGDERFLDVIKGFPTLANLVVQPAFYLNQVIGSRPQIDISESFEHDSADPQIKIGVKESNYSEAVYKSPIKQGDQQAYIYQIKGSDYNPNETNRKGYLTPPNNKLIEDYPFLNFDYYEKEALGADARVDDFYPFITIFKPIKGDLSSIEEAIKRSDGIGYVFNVRTTYPIIGSMPASTQCIISLGRLNARYYGGNYYSFVVKANGDIHVLRSELVGVGENGYTYRHAVVKVLKAQFAKLSQYYTSAVTCIVLMLKSSTLVIFTMLENLFVLNDDNIGKITAQVESFIRSNDVNDIYVATNNTSAIVSLRNKVDVYSLDATIYAHEDHTLLFSGFPIKFAEETTFVLPTTLPVFANFDIWNVDDVRIVLFDVAGRKIVLPLNNGRYYYADTNTEYEVSFLVKNNITKVWEETNQTTGGLVVVKTKIKSYDGKYFLKGVSGLEISKRTLTNIVTYNTIGGEFPLRFIKSIRIQRGHYNDNNTCQIEFIISPSDHLWNDSYYQMLNSSVISVDIYYKNRLIFSGVSVIDNYKTREKILNSKYEYVSINFEEDWLRRLKENSVIVQENLTFFRTHSQALKYILNEKIGIPQQNLVFAEDGVPLPLVMETSDNTEYVMVIGKDFYSYVDNIVSNFSGWTLYRNYALNDDNTNDIKIVYKPKPLFVDDQLLKATFYHNMDNYINSTVQRKAKIISPISIEEKRPFATGFVAIRPTTDIKSIATDYVIRSELIDNPNVPDYIGFPLYKHVLLPYRYNKYGEPSNIEPLIWELALRLLYGNRIARFKASFVPGLHYYSLVYIEGFGYGVIKSMQIDIAEQITCEYVVTLETGGIMYQW